MPELSMCMSTLLADPLDTTAAEIEIALDATAAAGFEGVSWWSLHQLVLGDDSLAAIHDRGLRVDVVETATAWAAGDLDAVGREWSLLGSIAEDAGAGVVGACVLDEDFDDRPAAVAAFGRLCEQAAEAGQRVALEFLPWTALPTLAAASTFLDDVDHPAGGLLFDTWHWQRQPSGTDPVQLDEVDLSRVVCVQLDDATSTPGAGSLFEETLHHRLVPGEGDIDMATPLRGIRASGADPIVSPEVFNVDLVRDPEAMADRVARGTRSVLEAVGWDG